MLQPVPTVLKVLIVEDSEDEALLLTHELRRAADEVCWQRVDSPEALQAALGACEWDLIISDHAMPRLTAVEAFDLVLATGREIPFIIYSGHISEKAALSAMAEGARDFVEKGDLKRLLLVVKRELRSAAQAKARAHAEHRLLRLVNYDQLTGLPNRQMFCEHANRLFDLGRGGAALLFIDVDRFMRINNTFGYAIGDLLVREVGARLQVAIGDAGVVARMGRDEFAVLDPHAHTPEQARALAERVMRAFERPFQIDDQEFYLTLSIGVCSFPGDGDDIGRLLVNAENAMFLAKRSGRNNYQVHVRDLDEAHGERLVLETSLRHAVKRGELLLHYQPSVDLASGRITAVEALVRWKHPTMGMIPPDKFIPLADETGLIGEIGHWVLSEACAQTRRWQAQGIDLKVAVNVSAVQFRQAGLVQAVAEVLASSGLAARCLDLEITETVLMQEADATIGTLRRLKEMGVAISVDDFGTGYSSLAYLQRFPIDTLKIDRSFMLNVTHDEHNAAIVHTVIALARSLGLESIAEGVETAEQVEFLRGAGCDRLQGYYFSRPLEPQALAELVLSGARLATVPAPALRSAHAV